MSAPAHGPVVPEPPRAAPIDYAALAEALAALAYPTRLELLDVLRFPHAVGEIRLSPLRSQAGENPERAASKQAVQAHLDKLVDVGLVRLEATPSEGRALNRYVVNAQRVYALVEELRSLSVRYAGRSASADATGTLGAPAQAEDEEGPRLVLVHGAYEGKTFRLEGSDAWTIGRRRGLPVSLDYDPFVSVEHARVERDGDGFRVVDLPASKNGTSVNWRPLAKGGARRLRPADVVGVGRSLLAFAPQ